MCSLLLLLLLLWQMGAHRSSLLLEDCRCGLLRHPLLKDQMHRLYRQLALMLLLLLLLKLFSFPFFLQLFQPPKKPVSLLLNIFLITFYLFLPFLDFFSLPVELLSLDLTLTLPFGPLTTQLFL